MLGDIHTLEEELDALFYAEVTEVRQHYEEVDNDEDTRVHDATTVNSHHQMTTIWPLRLLTLKMTTTRVKTLNHEYRVKPNAPWPLCLLALKMTT